MARLMLSHPLVGEWGGSTHVDVIARACALQSTWNKTTYEDRVELILRRRVANAFTRGLVFLLREVDVHPLGVEAFDSVALGASDEKSAHDRTCGFIDTQGYLEPPLIVMETHRNEIVSGPIHSVRQIVKFDPTPRVDGNASTRRGVTEDSR